MSELSNGTSVLRHFIRAVEARQNNEHLAQGAGDELNIIRPRPIARGFQVMKFAR